MSEQPKPITKSTGAAKAEANKSADTAAHSQLVTSILGKYRHIPTSAESFMNAKREDESKESQLQSG